MAVGSHWVAKGTMLCHPVQLLDGKWCWTITKVTAASASSFTRWKASLVFSRHSWKEGLSLGSWLQQSCINSISPSKAGVSGPGWGSSVNGGRVCLSHTASCASDVWATTGMGVGSVKRKHSGMKGHLLHPGEGQQSVLQWEVRREEGSLSR